MLILGSNSPRRWELLNLAGVKIDKVIPPNIDEKQLAGELPRAYAKRIALDKSKAIGKSLEDYLITADTAVAKGRRILGKPKDEIEARDYLRLLSGGRHRVLTAVCLTYNDMVRTRIVETSVKMKNLSNLEIESYIKCEEWKGKAGGYAIQGHAAMFIPFISGSYTNVQGLPLTETINLLTGMGFKLDLEELKN